MLVSRASTSNPSRLCRIVNNSSYSAGTFTKYEQTRHRHFAKQIRKQFGGRFDRPKVRAQIEDLVVPQTVPLERYADFELEGVQTQLSWQFISTVMDQFSRQTHIRELAAEQKISGRLFEKAFQSFRLYCCSENRGPHSIEPALRVVLSDIKNQEQSVDALYPLFVKHAHKVFPHLSCIKELQTISDLTKPHNWYPVAREIHRKVVFHAGPTNSGKTYEALQVLKNAKSGMYCGPLRLLAVEVYQKIADAGIPCDMLTGENRYYAFGPDNPAPHLASTVEMMSTEKRREVCVIDEIQMLRDPQRGSSWTRAVLGAPVDELHLCGEEAAIDIVCRILDPIGEHVSVNRYKRKGDLVVISTHGLRDLSNLEAGDCVVQFSKLGILQTARKVKKVHNKDCAIIFGDLPPETKRQQIERFNDQNDPCKIMIATDAIGMGMNLNIKRVIFSSLTRASGDLFPSYFVKQIAGRAGRFASAYCMGEAMTLKDDDAKLLAQLMNEPIEPIDKAGIGPTYEQIEMFALYLPKYSLVQLIDIFTSISTVSDEFFLCMAQNLKNLATLIEHIPLSLRDRYTFCMCPVGSGSRPFLNSSYVKMVRRYSDGNAITFEWMRRLAEPELKLAKKIDELNRLVDVHDFLDTYLWLSYRLEDYYPHREEVRKLKQQFARLIHESLEYLMEVSVDTETMGAGIQSTAKKGKGERGERLFEEFMGNVTARLKKRNEKLAMKTGEGEEETSGKRESPPKLTESDEETDPELARKKQRQFEKLVANIRKQKSKPPK